MSENIIDTPQRKPLADESDEAVHPNTEVLEASELEEVAGGKMSNNVGACGNVKC